MGAILNPTKAGGPLFDPARDAITGKKGVQAASVTNFVKPGGPLYDPVRDKLTSGGGDQAQPSGAQALMGGRPQPAPVYGQGPGMGGSSGYYTAGVTPSMVAFALNALGQNAGSTRPQDQI